MVDTLQKLNALAQNTKINHVKYGEGVIKEVIDTEHIVADILFGNEVKTLSLATLIERSLATVDNKLKEYVNNQLTNDLHMNFVEEHQTFLSEIEEKKVLREKLSREAKIENEINKLNNIDYKAIRSDISNYYKNLGWMAKHVTSVSAAMPDYLENWFVNRFGDVKRTVVNTKVKKKSQWGLSLTIRFKKVETMPAELKLKTTPSNESQISSVSLVWDLIENFGFDFGSNQDTAAIRNNIPSENLVDFDDGFNL